ncbi:nucleoside diphosphate kinase homolog 7 [Anabrus simplex]|uniref:nucleoside diphosphate kinase homolog 7 n=1 Tax=Anabrus simplex TaxID=316456 RepID=UPI0035A2C747
MVKNVFTNADDSRFTFITEWYDAKPDILRTFYMFFFPADDTLELFDVKNRVTFLKRTKCEGVSLADIYVGSTINIFSRQMTVTGFGDGFTKKKLGMLKQKTFGMLKPNVFNEMGEIIKDIYKNDFKITNLKMCTLNKEQATEFYKQYQAQPHLPFLVDYLMSGPVVAMELVAENAVVKWRELVGPTDPQSARKEAPHTLRAKYGKDKSLNSLHSSDSPEAAEIELSTFFTSTHDQRRPTPRTTAILKDTTCCIVKPHAMREGLLGDIIVAIQNKGFTISAMRMFYLDQFCAEEFYEVYKGVVPEYSGMVSELISGACVVMEIGGHGEETPVKFRAAVGPSDPDIAKQLRPDTLRAMFGKNKIENGVHCTDLPEDALMEVEYFFKMLE